jgi:hypothetical protein
MGLSSPAGVRIFVLSTEQSSAVRPTKHIIQWISVLSLIYISFEQGMPIAKFVNGACVT